MRLVKFSLALAALLVVNCLFVFSQDGGKDEMPGWEVVCVDGLNKGVVIPCPGFEIAGGNYAITREFSINTGMWGSGVSLTLTKLDKDPQHTLEIVGVQPARDLKDLNQEYWYANSFNGPGGPEGNLYFVTLRFFCKNPENAKNGRGGYCADGTYNGTLKFKDSKSGPVKTLTLTVNVTSNKKE
ncbi:MAG: hypothetical protein WBO10_11455 [Pyrinomonadaceae bacterium]